MIELVRCTVKRQSHGGLPWSRRVEDAQFCVNGVRLSARDRRLQRFADDLLRDHVREPIRASPPVEDKSVSAGLIRSMSYDVLPKMQAEAAEAFDDLFPVS